MALYIQIENIKIVWESFRYNSPRQSRIGLYRPLSSKDVLITLRGWAAAGFSHRGVGGLALIPVPALRALGLGALAVHLLPGLLLVLLAVLRHKISPQQ